MPYAPRVQRDQHTMTFACWCGATSRHKVVPSSWRITCPTCHRAAIIGNALLEASMGPAGRPPADLALPRSPDATTLIPSLAEPAPELTVAAGKWHSAEPITLDLTTANRPMAERWRDRRDGSVWLAVSIGMGTRYLCAPLANLDDRVLVGRREWVARMARLDEPSD